MVYIFRHVSVFAKNPTFPPFVSPSVCKLQFGSNLDSYVVNFLTCGQKSKFLSAFAVAESDSYSLRLFVRLSACITSAPIGSGVKFDIGDFFNLSINPQILLKSNKIIVHFTWRNKYVYIVESSTKYFVTRQRTVACPWHQKLPEGVSMLLYL